jgi:hypothetical protein
MMREHTPHIGGTAPKGSAVQKCPCRLPTREEIIQVRPGPQWQAPVQIGQLQRQWLLLPTHGLGYAHCRPRLRVLRLAINTLGYPFLWPTAVLENGGNRQASLKKLLTAAEQGWVRAEYVSGQWRFDPAALPALPTWPDASLDELAITAFPAAVEFLRSKEMGARK